MDSGPFRRNQRSLVVMGEQKALTRTNSPMKRRVKIGNLLLYYSIGCQDFILRLPPNGAGFVLARPLPL